MLTASEDGSLIFWKLEQDMDPDFYKINDTSSSYNEMVLMEKQEYETNVEKIQAQEDELKKLKTDTQAQLDLLKKKFEKDYASKEKSLDDELFDLTSKIDKIKAEIEAKNKEFSKKKDKENINHKEEIKRMKDDWDIKIDEEQERIEKLKLDKEAKERKYQEDRSEMDERHLDLNKNAENNYK